MHGFGALVRVVNVGRVAILAALVPALGGCWVVLGESFTGYGTETIGSDAGGDGGDAGDATIGTDGGGDGSPGGDGGGGDGSDASTPHQIGDCLPSFVVANGVVYPSTAPASLDLNGTLQVPTDTYAGCLDVGGPPLPYCLLLYYDLHLGPNAKLQTDGKRPVVIMTVQNLTTEAGSLIDLEGGDTGSFPGAGVHSKGIGTGPGAGGGNAEPGAGSGCGATGGATIAELGLIPGGNGGGPLDPRPQCLLGGSGGGAVQLVSLCGTITLRGTIDASGGAGGGGAQGDQVCADGYGGGAGGTVWLQSDKKIVFDNTSAFINLAGGGGGGGSCRPTAGDPWVPGGAGSRGDAGVGATCAGGNGGDGGLGGLGGPVAAHGPGVGGQGTGDFKCGGGGGGRGRLHLKAPETVCDVDVTSTGVCFQ